MAELTDRYTRRNVAMLMIDYASFQVGAAFLGMNTVLPALVLLLGGTPLHVGILVAIQSGGWLLPQLFAGRQLTNRPRVKNHMILWAGVSRTAITLFPVMLFLYGVRAPALALAALLLGLAGLWLGDALASVAWFEVVAKAIPSHRRGRVMGVAQSVGSFLGIGAGVLVKTILDRPLPFPSNHVLLMILAVVGLWVSLFAGVLIREPEGVGQGTSQPAWGEFLPRLIAILRTDARFTRLTVVRWLGGFADMANAFYVLYAVDRLQVPASTAGLFTSASVAGMLVSGLLLGPLGDSKGCSRVVQASVFLRLLCPVLALLSPLAAALHPWGPAGVLALVFMAGGMANGANMIGYQNYLLEIAPPAERATYMGLANTLGGLLTLAPLAAGWLVEMSSYETLFIVCLLLGLLALLAALRVPEPRRMPVVLEAKS